MYAPVNKGLKILLQNSMKFKPNPFLKLTQELAIRTSPNYTKNTGPNWQFRAKNMW